MKNNDVKLNELAKEAYLNAWEHGWWETVREQSEVIALICSELYEAFEDYRDRKMGLEYTESGKPVNFDSEMADVVIRVLDLFGRYDKKISLFGNSMLMDWNIFLDRSIPWWTKYLNYKVIECDSKWPYDFEKLNEFLSFVFHFCELNKIDIMKAVEVKMAYNKTRPYKHGNKVC